MQRWARSIASRGARQRPRVGMRRGDVGAEPEGEGTTPVIPKACAATAGELKRLGAARCQLQSLCFTTSTLFSLTSFTESIFVKTLGPF